MAVDTVDPTFEQRAARLRERLDAPEPTTWRPDDDTEGHPRLLIGELVAVQDSRTSFREQAQIAVVRDVGGQLWNVWLLHQVLIEEFARQQPTLGEMLAISYDGRVEGGTGGSGYEKYRLVVDRPGALVAWRDVDGQPAAPPAFAGVSPPPAAPAAAPLTQPAVPNAATVQPALDDCDQCGHRAGRHAAGCPNDLDTPPF